MSETDALANLTDDELVALYDAQYGAHSGAHQVYQAGRGEIPDLCLCCATEVAIEAEQERRAAVRPPAEGARQ
jgi:hypothetical protein